MKLLAFLVFSVVSIVFSNFASANPKVVFAHMANTKQAVAWSVDVGANGLEMDLRFDKNKPDIFQHSKAVTSPCDCSAGMLGRDVPEYMRHICTNMGVMKTCTASTDAEEMLAHIASFRDKVAVLYIDSKIDESIDLDMAGSNLIKFIDENLFEKGYFGQVLIGVDSLKYKNYITSANDTAKKSKNHKSYYFTFDGVSSVPNSEIVKKLKPGDNGASKNFKSAVQPLIDMKANRVYSVGISSLLPGTFYDQIALSANNVEKGTLSGSIIWTVDRPDVMEKYLNVGVDGIMTNMPGVAVRLIKEKNLMYADPKNLPAYKESNNDKLYVKAPVGAPCESNTQCENNACGRATAEDGAGKVCCPSNVITNYAGYDYCRGMSNGSTCWSDYMCSSGKCQGNSYGLQKGVCR